MKKGKLIAIVFIAFILIIATQLTSLATNEEFVAVETRTNRYSIYVKDVIGSQFQFAFSSTSDETNLDYISSTTDTQGNNIAYVDEALKTLFFNDDVAYLWVKTNEGTNVISGAKIDLASATKSSELEELNLISKTITVNSKADNEKITINGKQDEAYFYKLLPAETSEEYQRLIELIEEIQKYNEDTNVYTKIQTYLEFNNLYNKLRPEIDDETWVKAENLEIEKPAEAQENQKYILWLKDGNGTTDIQVLTTYQTTVTNTEVQEKVVEETATLPNTYDNTSVLYIALAIVVVAIIAMVVIRKIFINKNNKK